MDKLRSSKEIVRNVREGLIILNPKLDFEIVEVNHGEMAIVVSNPKTIRDVELPRSWELSKTQSEFNSVSCNMIEKKLSGCIYYRIPLVVYKNIAHLPEFKKIEDIK